MPRWPLEAQVSREPEIPKPIKKPKQPRNWRQGKQNKGGEDLDITGAMQHRTHAKLLTLRDNKTGVVIPIDYYEEALAPDTHPQQAFPGIVAMPDAKLHLFAAYTASDTYAGVRVHTDLEHSKTHYWGCSFTDAETTEQFVAGRHKMFVTADAETFLTFHEGRRRVMQHLMGAVLLANQGAPIDTHELPEVGTKELLLSEYYKQLYRYGDAPAENGTLYMAMGHHQESITTFKSFVTDDEAVAHKLFAALEEDVFTRVGGIENRLDIAFLSGRDPATEEFIGDMIARVTVLPDIFPIVPPGRHSSSITAVFLIK